MKHFKTKLVQIGLLQKKNIILLCDFEENIVDYALNTTNGERNGSKLRNLIYGISKSFLSVTILCLFVYS